MTIGNITVASLESKKLCTPRKVQVGLLVTKQQLQLSVDSHTDQSNSEQLSVLHQAMMTNVVTYLGGLPGELYLFSFICSFVQASLRSALPKLYKEYNCTRTRLPFSPPRFFLFHPVYAAFEGAQFSIGSLLGPLRGISLSLEV